VHSLLKEGGVGRGGETQLFTRAKCRGEKVKEKADWAEGGDEGGEVVRSFSLRERLWQVREGEE